MSEQAVSLSRKESVLRLARQYDPDPHHSDQVTRLALRLFDEACPLHRLDSDARELLEYACLLHDIGYSGDQAKHKRRSYEMIKSARLNGFSDAEREIIASVARYHGRKPPKKGHAWNKILSKKDKEKVRYLSGIIRVADALDRTHRGVVEDLHCLIDNDRIVLQLKSRSPADEELQTLDRKKGYFEKLFGRTVETG